MPTLTQAAWHGMIFHPELSAIFDALANRADLTFTAYAQPNGNAKVAKFSYKKTLNADEYRAFIAKYPAGSIDMASFFTSYIADKMDKLLVQPDTVWMTMEEMEKENA